MPGRLPAGDPGGRSRPVGGGYAARVSSSEKKTPEPAPGAVRGPRPARLAVAAAGCLAEALALLAGGVYLLVEAVTGDPDSPQQAVTLGVTVLVLGAIPLIAARGLWLRRRWSRGPAMITQIMALPAAWALLTASGALVPAGVALAVVAVAGLVALVNPTTTEALGIRGPAGDDA